MTIWRIRWGRMARCGFSAILLVWLAPWSAWTGGSVARAQQGQDKTKAFDNELERGRQLLQRREYFEALKTLQRANQLAGGRSAECFLLMAQAMNGMKVYPNAVSTAQSAIDLAPADARVLTRAHSVKGLALQSLADKEKDAAKLRDAEAEFRQALIVDPEATVPDLHFNLGLVLMQQGRDDEGIVEMKRELELRANGTTPDRARELIANPRRARENYAPDFAFVSSAGARISLESLRGKVVLLDFWGTRCAPCVQALPSIRKMQKDHASEPFVIVGISADEDELMWRTFTTKNGMVWPQYRDEDRGLQRTFGVGAFPTYILIDPQGIERFRISGTGFKRDSALGSAIDKQLKAAPPH
jgi:thiol-disulfide isomerase/thioredoxin